LTQAGYRTMFRDGISISDARKTRDLTFVLRACPNISEAYLMFSLLYLFFSLSSSPFHSLFYQGAEQA